MNFTIVCRKALYFRGSLSICPAYAGMILMEEIGKGLSGYLSRVCGDDPSLAVTCISLYGFVPRMRG